MHQFPAGIGSIINFGSVSWKRGTAICRPTPPARVQGLTRGLARDFGPYGIRVNTLVPGCDDREEAPGLWVTPETADEIKRSQCIGRPVQPIDIARMALFLAADDSRMCSAQDFIVDGGWVQRRTTPTGCAPSKGRRWWTGGAGSTAAAESLDRAP